MLFANFLNTNIFGGSDGFFSVGDTVGSFEERSNKSLEPFAEADLNYFEKDKAFIFSEVENPDWGSNETMTNLFNCSDARAKEINGVARNKEEDMVLIVDKIRFIEGCKSYFKVLPLGDAMVICLYAGAAEFFVGGEWILMNRTGKGISSATKRHEMSSKRLLDFVKIEDKESGYDMTKDGISACEFLIVESKSGTKSVKSKTISSEFILVREDKLKMAQEKARKQKEIRQKELERKKAENAAFEARRKEMEAQRQEAESENKKKKDLKPKTQKTLKAKSITSKPKKEKEKEVTVDMSAASFMDILKDFGYEG